MTQRHGAWDRCQIPGSTDWDARGRGEKKSLKERPKAEAALLVGEVGVGVGMCVHFVGEQGVGTLLEVIVTGLKEDASCGI